MKESPRHVRAAKNMRVYPAALVVLAQAVSGTPSDFSAHKKQTPQRRTKMSHLRFEGMFTMMRNTTRPLVCDSKAHVASGDVTNISKK
jgi:hypothetical protein